MSQMDCPLIPMTQNPEHLSHNLGKLNIQLKICQRWMGGGSWGKMGTCIYMAEFLLC